MLLAGFGTGDFTRMVGKRQDFSSWKGESFSVVLDHPESGYTPAHTREMRERSKKLVEDPSIKKALQNGSYDKASCKEQLGARLRGYDYDTMYGTYLRYSFLRSCSLENLTYLFFPEFADYKEVTAKWSDNFANCPLENLVLRNGGDCDVTKRLEVRFSNQISYELNKVYIHCGITLDKMEHRGPILDYEQHAKAVKIVPELIAKLDRMLQQISGDPDFDCDSHDQVAHLVYDVLGMPESEEGGRSTNKTILEGLAAETGNPTLELIIKDRALRKIKSTYLEGYANSARLHKGELRTIWWLTGTVSGRLRSGKGDKGDAQGIVNMANFHGNPLLLNLLVSDKNWRLAMED